jgi:tetratricopeptide (TPR) repeat protein
MLTVLLLALLEGTPGVPGLVQNATDACEASSLQVLQEAAALVGRAGPISTQSMLVEAAKNDSDCAPLLGAGWSINGWAVARAAVRHGGTPDSLVDAKWAAQVLEKIGLKPEWRVESEYARAAISAAEAASQDERPQMAIFLAHARGLSDRLTLARATPRWPLPIDLLEGDLWLEVDRYDEALAAFERALKLETTAFALVGLARTRDRLGDKAGACDAYRQALETAERALLDEARAYLVAPPCKGRL